MNPIQHIRKNVFGLSQTDFAVIAGSTQASVSRWESGALEPSRDELDRIRSEAKNRGIDWDDRLFFDVPVATPEQVAAS